MQPRTDDDIYLQDGESFQDGIYYPGEPEERVERETTEAATKAASYPVLSANFEWFEQQIAKCDSISNVQVTSMTVNGVKYDRTTSIEGQVLAYQLLKELLTQKAKEYKQFAESVDE